MKNLVQIAITSLLLTLALTGCEKKIGDSCGRDMECSADGDRICDNNQPGGYCLIITCSPDQCPGEAACAEFVTPSPNFDTDTTSDSDATLDTSQTEVLYAQLAPNRARTYCLRKCTSDKGCRSGYICALDEVLEEELGGLIIDSQFEGLGICVPK